MVLEAVYEPDFLDCSYGFRPGRFAHQALEVLREGVMTMGGGWVLEVDIRPPARRIRRSSTTSTAAPPAPRSSPLRANVGTMTFTLETAPAGCAPGWVPALTPATSAAVGQPRGADSRPRVMRCVVTERPAGW